MTGRRVIETGYLQRISVREENAAAALEVMSRFAIDPRWLLYLPPTMSPVATSARPDLLEHPDQAFDAYRAEGVDQVVCEEKHMGSRAVALVCRDLDAARARFGAPGDALGAVWTRTGRPFFDPAADRASWSTASAPPPRRPACSTSSAPPGCCSTRSCCRGRPRPSSCCATSTPPSGRPPAPRCPAAVSVLEQAAAAGLDVSGLLARTRSRAANADAFTAAYRRYCWETDGLTGIRVAPFQLLASEGAAHQARPHAWHLDVADRLVAADPRPVHRHPPPVRRHDRPGGGGGGRQPGGSELTGAGGEGMVVKPAANLTRASKGLVQPGLKVRGREYLRIIYGPDYTEPANLGRLRQRGLGHKRSMAQREYALGLEALDRVARGEPLWRVHECVFAVLALESEPVDPRL